ncbi:type II restriction enzyme [Carboxylicivirga marina]|uniref:Transcriptional regulator n=1 Tax=Carboxylicivirga marina TaxID=2800988 RepID=A0ABS1HMB4_9BACT|nr:hypothetical protein [Carboxylicivirga marina]MBK3518595.1 hypothetical protein [Carboxylicivirga marina]
MSNASKNDVAWQELFEQYNIAKIVNETGCFEITSATINKLREARLMTKFDYASQLPAIFKQYHLSILPNSRGGYIISDFETFQKFENNNSEIIEIEFPAQIESINYNNITSESTAINCAYLSGILSDFLGKQKLYQTINGRMSSSEFSFNIQTSKQNLIIDVKNAQIEIDAGFESNDSIILIEAKNNLSDDFLIRQLYYPYRLWRNKSRKDIRSVFLTYSDGVFHCREFDFDDPNNYNSIRQINEKKYAISNQKLDVKALNKLMQRTPTIAEPPIPFPQADSFERIINLCELLNSKESLSRNAVTENYDFNIRQTNYYTDACRYLGLVEKQNQNQQIEYQLTSMGQQLFKMTLAQRKMAFIEQVLKHQAFKACLQLYFEKGEKPSKDEVVEIMKRSELYNVNSESTYYRRASTISHWLNWILFQISL